MEQQTQLSDLTGGANLSSPRLIYISFLLKLFSEFYTICATDIIHDGNIERGLACLVAFIPRREVRERIWNKYQSDRITMSSFSASVLAVGDAVEYLAEALELETHTVGLEV